MLYNQYKVKTIKIGKVKPHIMTTFTNVNINGLIRLYNY